MAGAVVTVLTPAEDSDSVALADAGSKVRVALRNPFDEGKTTHHVVALTSVFSNPTALDGPRDIRHPPRVQWRKPPGSTDLLALSSILVFFTTFLAAGLAALIGWFALQRLGAEAVAEDVSDHLLDESPRLLKDDAYSTISPWARLLEKSDFIRIMHRHLQQAGLTWSVGRVTLLMLLASSVALGFAMQFEWIPGWANLLIAVAVAAVPYVYILRCRAKRFRLFEEQFPDALDSLARSLRAGHPFPAAMDAVSEECEQPVAAEFQQTAMEGNLGTSWDAALSNLGERCPCWKSTCLPRRCNCRTAVAES